VEKATKYYRITLFERADSDEPTKSQFGVIGYKLFVSGNWLRARTDSCGETYDMFYNLDKYACFEVDDDPNYDPYN